MAPYGSGVLVAYSNAGGNGYQIWFSPNGRGLGGGQLVYDGSSPVTAIIPYKGGVLTAFTNAGPNGNRIHWSPNGQNLGGGPIMYDGGSPVVAMIPGPWRWRADRLHERRAKQEPDSLEPRRAKSGRRPNPL